MSKTKLISTLTMITFIILSIVPTYAGDAPSMMNGDVQKALAGMAKQMEEMRQLIQSQNAKIEMLEQKTRDGVNVSQGTPATGSAPTAMSEKEFQDMLKNEVKNAGYFKNLKMGGDFRLRYEGFREQNSNQTGLAAPESRNRFRYRLRYGIENGIGDDLTVGFRLASATLASQDSSSNGARTIYGSDPASTNQTFGSPGLFSFNTIAIEKAYAKYEPKALKDVQLGSTKLKGVEIGGGKFDNPFLKYSSAMVWDGDVTPEGLYEKFNWGLYENEGNEINLFGTAMQSPLIESGSGSRDASLFGFQGGVNLAVYTPALERPVEFTSSVADYLYKNFSQYGNFTLGGGNTSLARGNTTCLGGTATTNGGTAGDCPGLDMGDPNILDFYNELKITPMNMPLKLFSDVATNVNNGSGRGGSASKNTGWGFGLGVGELKDAKSWQVSYGYYQIPPNAVVGAFSDSDFGQGHSNNVGGVVKAGYQLTKNMQLNFAWYRVNPYDPALAVNGSVIGDHTTNRFQSDLVWKF